MLGPVLGNQVYTLRWNERHDRTFLSASADWTVQIWDDAKPEKVCLHLAAETMADLCAWSCDGIRVHLRIAADLSLIIPHHCK